MRAAAPSLPQLRPGSGSPLCLEGAPETLMKPPDRRGGAGVPGSPQHPPAPSPAEPLTMAQGFWQLYKAKVLQTLGEARADGALQEEGDQPELMEVAEPPVLMEEGPSPVSQLARKVQGVGARGWRTLSSLFTREDEHQLLSPELCADHPLAASPPEPPPSEKASSFWDLFATKWQQAPGLDKEVSPPAPAESPAEPSGDDGSDLREPEEGAFRWGFLAGKLAEIRNKTAPRGK
ncbi:uncharacterized protein C1orf232 homolog isoform X1 [Lathamus discolor]|uniref:uncharacterized protein C1orf232 homolog isoform X1 n=1 Tax=Lathamus discolor TaxID=678569 RepID=UPI0032B860D7